MINNKTHINTYKTTPTTKNISSTYTKQQNKHEQHKHLNNTMMLTVYVVLLKVMKEWTRSLPSYSVRVCL